jgi:hypothetical protein
MKKTVKNKMDDWFTLQLQRNFPLGSATSMF